MARDESWENGSGEEGGEWRRKEERRDERGERKDERKKEEREGMREEEGKGVERKGE